MLFLLACSLESIPPAEEAPAPPQVADEPEPAPVEAVEAPPEVDDTLAIPADEEPTDSLPSPFGELPAGTVAEVEPLINELSGVEVGLTGRLTLDQVVAGVPCKAGEVTMTEERFSCRLSLPATIGGYALARGSQPGFHPDGSLARVSFGDLVPPTEMRLIEGVPCLSRVVLHPDGKVSACTLSRGHRIGSAELPRGTDVELRADGSLLSTISYEPIEVGGRSYEAGLTNFTPEGVVEHHSPGVFGD